MDVVLTLSQCGDHGGGVFDLSAVTLRSPVAEVVVIAELGNVIIIVIGNWGADDDDDVALEQLALLSVG